jgi:hypothetical protein
MSIGFFRIFKNILKTGQLPLQNWTRILHSSEKRCICGSFVALIKRGIRQQLGAVHYFNSAAALIQPTSELQYAG